MIAVIVYAKFAPFHCARLEAAGSVGTQRQHRLIGIGVASTQEDYQWPAEGGGSVAYHRVTLFHGRDYWRLRYGEVRRTLHQILDDLKPDVLVLPGWGFKESLAGLGWCLRRGVPRVVISDSQSIDNAQTIGKTRLKRLLVRQFQSGFAGGTPHLRYLRDLGLRQERCVVGCDVVDNDFFSCESGRWRRLHEREGSGATLLSCVRLLPRKNVQGVLESLAMQKTSWNWTIVGDGPERVKLERSIQALGLQRRVRLLGHVDYFQLPGLYAQADAYLQPSLSEPWGLAVNEAMASGLPVVVSNRCGCHEDLVQEGVNGFTFDPGSSGSLTQALERLWESRARWGEMGQVSRRIIAQWGLDRFAENFWRACEIALHAGARCSETRIVDSFVKLAL
jgi:glycosyltransferase involved in cell wall biosynthesis